MTKQRSTMTALETQLMNALETLTEESRNDAKQLKQLFKGTLSQVEELSKTQKRQGELLEEQSTIISDQSKIIKEQSETIELLKKNSTEESQNLMNIAEDMQEDYKNIAEDYRDILILVKKIEKL